MCDDGIIRDMADNIDNPRLSDIGLDPLQRAKVLEWFARKIWIAIEEGSGLADYSGKSYDPLTIELRSDGGGVAHSYIFNFRDGGRHHSFDSLDSLEDWLLEEAIIQCKWLTKLGTEERNEGTETYQPSPSPSTAVNPELEEGRECPIRLS